MNEAFNFQSAFPVYGFDLFQGQFPGGDDPAGARLLQKPGSFRAAQGHLCAGMDIQVRERLADVQKDAHILYNHCVQSLLVIGKKVIIQLFQLLVLQKRVDSQVEPAAMQVAVVHRLQKLFFRKIVCVGPGSKTGASHIDGVCACRHSGFHALKGAGRG